MPILVATSILIICSGSRIIDKQLAAMALNSSFSKWTHLPKFQVGNCLFWSFVILALITSPFMLECPQIVACPRRKCGRSSHPVKGLPSLVQFVT